MNNDDDVDEDEEISSEIRNCSNYTYNDYFNNNFFLIYILLTVHLNIFILILNNLMH